MQQYKHCELLFITLALLPLASKLTVCGVNYLKERRGWGYLLGRSLIVYSVHQPNPIFIPEGPLRGIVQDHWLIVVLTSEHAFTVSFKGT